MITVHAGLHKTGSTSIRVALGLCTHRRGLSMASPRYSGSTLDGGWVRRVERAARGRHVVISDESILGEPEAGYRDARTRASEWALRFPDSDLRFILYVRPQVEWLSSVYLQLVQQGVDLDVSSFWQSVQNERNLRWTHLTMSLIDVLGQDRVVVRPYLHGSDVVDDFFSISGIGKAPSGLHGGVRENVSIRAEQVPIARALLARQPDGSETRRGIRALLQQRSALQRGRRLSPFPEGMQREMSQVFDGDWVALTQVLSSMDPLAAERMADYAWQSIEFAGDEISSPLVLREMLSLTEWTAEREAHRSSRLGIWHRVREKALCDPKGLPSAVYRAVLDKTRRM